MTARILVTGAAGGIGAATAAALRGRGCTVTGLDLLATSDGVLACEVRDAAQVAIVVGAAIDAMGGLDVLINCAGVGDVQGAGDPPDADALALLDVNFFGSWRVTAAALPALRASRGRVVNVASGLVFLTLPFAAAYCASKRALVAYSDALRLEHGDAVTVTTVYPGYIRTAIHARPAAKGLSLEGLVPAERLDNAVDTLVRAALGRPRRDMATTRRGAVAHALLRTLPPRWVDRAVITAMRRVRSRGSGVATRAA